MNSTDVASTPKRRKKMWEIPFGFEREMLAYERKKGLDFMTSLYRDAFEISQPKGLEAGRDEGVMDGWTVLIQAENKVTVKAFAKAVAMDRSP